MDRPRPSLLRESLHGMRQNLAPGIGLWLLASAVVLAYYHLPAAAPVFARIGQWKADWGFGYSAIATALFGGLIPWCYLSLSGRIPRGSRASHLVFLLAFWTWKGMEVDLLYRLQAQWFGDGHGLSTIVCKVAVDQFVYNPLWAAPTQGVLFQWKDRGFTWAAFTASCSRELVVRTIPLVLLSTWLIWVPAVAIVYCLPGDLQVPLFNIVLCFWVLLLSVLAKPQEAPAS